MCWAWRDHSRIALHLQPPLWTPICGLRNDISSIPFFGGTLGAYELGLPTLCQRRANFAAITSSELAALLAVLRAKLVGEEIDEHLGLPVRELMASELRSTLAIFRVLGRYRLTADMAQPSDDPISTMAAAARVLTSWPQNFFTLMNDLGRLGGVDEGAVGKQFKGLYSSLTRNRVIGRTNCQFLIEAFLDFVQNHWSHGYVDPKLVGSEALVDRRFLTLAGFAERIGVQPRTALRLLRTNVRTAERITCGKASRIIVDARSGPEFRRSPGAVLRTRVVASSLNIPVSVLLQCTSSGSQCFLRVGPPQKCPDVVFRYGTETNYSACIRFEEQTGLSPG